MKVSLLPNRNGVGFNLPKLSDNESVNLMLYTALAERGTRETGNNIVGYNDWFYNTSVSGGDYAWCAVFVSWVANTTGVMGNNIIKSNRCSVMQSHYAETGNLHLNGTGYKPKAGDVFL